MNFNLYFPPFLISFFSSVILTAIVVWLCGKFGEKISEKKSKRHIHRKNISRLGGVAIIFSFMVAVFLSDKLVISPTFWGILIASILIMIIGLWDDFRELNWQYQLFFQVALAVFIFIMGVKVEYISHPFGGIFSLNIGKYLLPSLLFVILWIIAMMNSVNWLDGIDGLSGGVTFLGAVTIFFLSLKPEVNQPPVGIITMALSGAILGFLIFNFHPARIFAGTSGAWFMGFMLGSLAIFAGTKIATALLIMAVPVIDAIWVIGERLKTGKSIFSPDNRHLHFKLLELGWSQNKITVFFYGVTAFVAVIALNTRAIGKLVTIILVAVIMVATLAIINKKISGKKTVYSKGEGG